MDLHTMKEKLRAYKYLSAQEFIDDMKIIKSNCHLYNAVRNPHLPPMADLIYTVMEDALKEVRLFSILFFYFRVQRG